MSRRVRTAVFALGTIGALVGSLAVPTLAGRAGGATATTGPAAHRVRHVLLVSVDGMHESDLQWYVETHPGSVLALLAARGVQFTSAQTPIPSDSFPGMVGQLTGGNPSTTGVYYDDSYNYQLLAPGSTHCAGVKPGTEVAYTEDADRVPTAIDAGQGLPGLPNGVLAMTPRPATLLDPKKLPVSPATCRPVYPHQYLRVNTVFDVVKAHGQRTAWSDKHPAYDILEGPSGRGIDDLFTPEVNSNAPARYTDITGAPGDWTTNNFATRQYDGYKVQAVLNEIDGYDHSGRHRVGVPGIFGMNFQTVSTAEKLPSSVDPTTGKSYRGGYLTGGYQPGPLLASAFDWLNGRLGLMVAELSRRGLAGSTALILSAKHGQSPTDPRDLTRVDDGTVIGGLNAAWRSAGHRTDLVAFAVDDDIMLLWLSDRSPVAADFATRYLLRHPATGTTYNRADPNVAGPDRVVTQSGLRAVYAGVQAASYWGVRVGEPRHPDVVGLVQHGVVYTGGTGKIAEHGGDDPQDRGVPLLVVAPGAGPGGLDNRTVETTSIAPTILALLGLDPRELDAVRIEATPTLPTR
jgi:hypothetical protein